MSDTSNSSRLERVSSDCSADDVVELLQRDGAVIIERFANPATIEQIRTEMHPYLEACPGGRDRFAGLFTARAGAVMARSRASHELVLDPMLNEACATFLAPHA